MQIEERKDLPGVRQNHISILDLLLRKLYDHLVRERHPLPDVLVDLGCQELFGLFWSKKTERENLVSSLYRRTSRVERQQEKRGRGGRRVESMKEKRASGTGTHIRLSLVDSDDGDLILQPSNRVSETDGHGSGLGEVSDLRREVSGEISREGCRRRGSVGGDNLEHARKG